MSSRSRSVDSIQFTEATEYSSDDYQGGGQRDQRRSTVSRESSPRDRNDSNASFAISNASHNSSQASFISPHQRGGRRDSLLFRVDSVPRLRRSPNVRNDLRRNISVGRDRIMSTASRRGSDAEYAGRDRGYSIESISAYRYPASPLILGGKDDDLIFEDNDRRDSTKSSLLFDEDNPDEIELGEEAGSQPRRKSVQLDNELATRTRQWQAQRIAHFLAGIPGLKLKWHGLVTIVILYNAFFVPIRTAYPQHTLNIGWIIFDYVGDIIFWIDILLNFRRPIVIHGDAVTNRRVIARVYLRGWFAVDALASLPLDFFAWSPNIHAALRLPRVLRLFRLFHYIQKAEGYSQWVGVSRLGKLFFVIALIIHLMSCTVHLISRGEGYVSHPDWELWSNIDEQDIAVAYLRDYFWSMALLTGLGPDVSSPKSEGMFGFMFVSIVIGLLVVASIIANVGTVFTGFYAERTRWLEEMHKISSYMKRKDVPKNMQRKIRDHFQYVWSVHHGLSENQIMSKLPDHIRGDVAYHMHADLLKKVPIFKECQEEGFRRALCLHMKFHLYAPGDYVIRANEVGTRMFFIVKGLTEIIGPTGSVLAQRRTGQSFGENGLLYKGTRTASVRALSYCEILSLSKDDLDDVLVDYPQYCEVIDRAADEQLVLLYGSREEFLLSEDSRGPIPVDVRPMSSSSQLFPGGGSERQRARSPLSPQTFDDSQSPPKSGYESPTIAKMAAVDSNKSLGGSGGAPATVPGGGLFSLPTLNGMLRQTAHLRLANASELVAMQSALLRLQEKVGQTLSEKVSLGDGNREVAPST